MSKRASQPKTELQRRADVLAKRRPDLAGWARFFERAHAVQDLAERSVEPIELPKQYIEDKRTAGRAALDDEDLPFDPDALQATLLALCDCALPTKSRTRLGGLLRGATPAGGMETAVRAVRDAVAAGQLSALDLSVAYLGGGPANLHTLASSRELDAMTTRRLIECTLQPWFRAWARQIGAIPDEWPHATCPNCGSWPLFSEIAGKEGARKMRCALCSAGWVYGRLQCLSCGTTDHAQLGRLQLEGEDEKYFIQTCDKCKQYDKFINNYEPIAPELLMLEDMICADYDDIAQNRGYSRSGRTLK